MKGETQRDPVLEFDNKTFDEWCVFQFKSNPHSIGYDEIKFSTHNNPIILVNMGDIHTGCRYWNGVKFKDDIHYIADTEGVYVILTGDYRDNFNRHSKGAGIYDQSVTSQQADIRMREAMDILGEKVLGIVSGCHDLWSLKDEGREYSKELSAMNKVSYWLGHGANITFECGEHDYVIHACHKFTKFSSKNISHGAKEHYRDNYSFDVVFGAHRHTVDCSVARVKPYETMTGSKMVYVLRCGSYKITDNFLSSKRFPHALPIMPCILLGNGENKEITPFLDMRTATKFLKMYQ